MLRVLFVIQALCSYTPDEAPVSCLVQWRGNDVIIVGYHEDQGVMCTVLNAAEADCREGTFTVRDPSK